MKQNIKEKIAERLINCNNNLLFALKQMDEIDKKLLLVFDGDVFLNILSIGDIQRAILKDKSLTTSIKEILRNDTKIANEEDSFSFIKKAMEKYRIECMPVVNNYGKLVNVYFWEDVFGREKEKQEGLGKWFG